MDADLLLQLLIGFVALYGAVLSTVNMIRSSPTGRARHDRLRQAAAELFDEVRTVRDRADYIRDHQEQGRESVPERGKGLSNWLARLRKVWDRKLHRRLPLRRIRRRMRRLYARGFLQRVAQTSDPAELARLAGEAARQLRGIELELERVM